ncbi:hypothetical protein B4089_1277 [Bacillus licheniformis]|nr:hypothetical protein B4089_1277 [Bacillus licheniformis]
MRFEKEWPGKESGKHRTNSPFHQTAKSGRSSRLHGQPFRKMKKEETSLRLKEVPC